MRTVVERASFSIAPGETVGLVGESGSGKTVSAMSIIGLLPAHGEVQSGRIVFGGRDLASLSETQMRGLRGREIGLISQEPLVSMNPAFRVGRQLAEVVRLHRGLSRRESYKEALQLLRDVHLPDPEGVASCYPHELSGGMAQRVVIARALAGNPKLLIADEPTTALDVTVQAEILDLLRELKKTRGMAMLLVTHDWGVAADTCDRVIVMYAGQVVESAPIEAIFREPRHPYTEALLAADVHRTELTGALSTIPGTVPVAGTWPSGCHFHPRCLYATVECTSREITMENTGPGRQTRCVHHEKLAGKGAKSPS